MDEIEQLGGGVCEQLGQEQVGSGTQYISLRRWK